MGQVHGAHLHLRWLRLDLGAWVVLHLQRVHEICRKEEDVLVELSSVYPGLEAIHGSLLGGHGRLQGEADRRRSIPSGRVTRGG